MSLGTLTGTPKLGGFRPWLRGLGEPAKGAGALVADLQSRSKRGFKSLGFKVWGLGVRV